MLTLLYPIALLQSAGSPAETVAHAVDDFADAVSEAADTQPDTLLLGTDW